LKVEIDPLFRIIQIVWGDPLPTILVKTHSTVRKLKKDC